MDEQFKIEMLTPERVTELWPKLEPLFDQACKAHEIARDEMEPRSLHDLAVSGMAVVFVVFVNDEPSCLMAIQFHETNGRRGADVIALAGSHLLLYKSAYWEAILEWLQINGVEFLDAYVPQERSHIYKKRFGFNKSCTHLRMNFEQRAEHE